MVSLVVWTDSIFTVLNCRCVDCVHCSDGCHVIQTVAAVRCYCRLAGRSCSWDRRRQKSSSADCVSHRRHHRPVATDSLWRPRGEADVGPWRGWDEHSPLDADQQRRHRLRQLPARLVAYRAGAACVGRTSRRTHDGTARWACSREKSWVRSLTAAARWESSASTSSPPRQLPSSGRAAPGVRRSRAARTGRPARRAWRWQRPESRWVGCATPWRDCSLASSQSPWWWCYHSTATRGRQWFIVNLDLW